MSRKLPSLAAAALERAGTVPTRGDSREAEAYAAGPYLADLLQGAGATRRPSRASATGSRALTGLDPGLRPRGRRDGSTAGSVQREIGRDEGRVASAYDTGVTGWDPDPTAPHSGFEDPLLTGMQAPLTSAMLDLYATTPELPGAGPALRTPQQRGQPRLDLGLGPQRAGGGGRAARRPWRSTATCASSSPTASPIS